MRKRENRVSASDISLDERKSLGEALNSSMRPVLIGPNGSVSEMPKALQDVFLLVIRAMQKDQAVIVLSENEALSTQAAADYLGLSRQHLVRLLDGGKIPFHMAGTHRRVAVRDVAAYDEERSRERRAGLDRMTEELVNADLFDRYIPLEKADSK